MHLTVIAKEPRPGFVKTRLCPPCTPQQAADLATAALADTLDAVNEVAKHLDGAVQRVLLFDGDSRPWRGDGYHALAQRGDGLAERLANAFDDLGPGIVIGMETPQAVASLVGGFAALERGCDTLGLAVDGGYWAIGLHQVDPRALSAIPMSASHTGLAQLSRLYQLGRSTRLLPMARDLDTIDDVVAASRRDRGSRLTETARATLMALSRDRPSSAGRRAG